MSDLSKLIKKYKITFNDIDFRKKIKLSTIFNYFQEIGDLHSQKTGGSTTLLQQEYGLTWVLTRIKVDIDRYPTWNEEIILETWFHKPKKYQIQRDFVIKDLDGNIIIKAISSWIIFDIEERKMKSIDSFETEFLDYLEDKAIDCNLKKIRPIEEVDIVYKRLIGCSDIDANKHLNNSKYIDFIIDCFSMDELEKHYAKSIQVDYLNEALPGDTIVFYKNIDLHNVYIEGVNESNNNVIFRSTIDIAKF